MALTGATVMLLLSPQPIEDALEEIEWATLFFFLALFVVVGALEETGALEEVATAITDVTGELLPGHRARDHMGERVSLRRLVDNIPFTTAMIPVVQQTSRRPPGERLGHLLVGAGAGSGLRRQRHSDRSAAAQCGGGRPLAAPSGPPDLLPRGFLKIGMLVSADRRWRSRARYLALFYL